MRTFVVFSVTAVTNGGSANSYFAEPPPFSGLLDRRRSGPIPPLSEIQRTLGTLVRRDLSLVSVLVVPGGVQFASYWDRVRLSDVLLHQR